MGDIHAYIYSFLVSGNFGHRLITFEKSLDPDQDRHNISPDLDPDLLTHSDRLVFLIEVFEKVNFEKVS